MEENLYEDATLKVGENPVFFNKDAGEKSIAIQTNRDKWEATSAQEGEWISLTKEGSMLKIAVTEHRGGADRTAIVSVHAGDITERIAVHQRASEIVLEAESNDIKMYTAGGSRKLKLHTNVLDIVKVEAPETDWLKVNYTKGEKTFELIAEENKTLSSRIGKILLSAGQQAREITVTQDGVLDLAFPPMVFPTTLRDAMKFEAMRGTILSQTPDGFQNKRYYMYATGSNLITKIDYEYSNVGLLIFDSTIATASDPELLQGPNFEAFMNQKGFVKTKSSKTVHNYTNEDLQFHGQVSFPSEGGARLTITYVPKQTESYPTFSNLTAFSQYDLIGDYDEKLKGARKPEVLAFEASIGGTLDENSSVKHTSDNPTRLVFDSAPNSDKEFARMYSFITAKNHIKKGDPAIGEVDLTMTLASDISKAFWKFEHKYILTKELITLMESKGYNY